MFCHDSWLWSLFLKQKTKSRVEKRHQNTACGFGSQRTWEKRGGGDGNEEQEMAAALASQKIDQDGRGQKRSKAKPARRDWARGSCWSPCWALSRKIIGESPFRSRTTTRKTHTTLCIRNPRPVVVYSTETMTIHM